MFSLCSWNWKCEQWQKKCEFQVKKKKEKDQEEKEDEEEVVVRERRKVRKKRTGRWKGRWSTMKINKKRKLKKQKKRKKMKKKKMEAEEEIWVENEKEMGDSINYSQFCIQRVIPAPTVTMLN